MATDPFLHIEQQITARFAYPVYFTEGVFTPGHAVLREVLERAGAGRETRRALCFIDSGVALHHPSLADRIRDALASSGLPATLVHEPRVVPGGEGVKNDYRLIMEMLDTMLEYRLCRHSLVFAVGGGAVLDAVGFAASLVHRGLRLIRVPTTTLAQCDAGIGVKNGMNLHGGKNVVGAFDPPFAVLNDATFLATLPFEQWIGGVSEAFKVALIKDADFFGLLCDQSAAVRGRDLPTLLNIIRRCAELHLDHLREGGDPFERGEARPLDFGHWSAHKLEAMSGYQIGHGAAVATGIAIDACMSAELGWIPAETVAQLLQGLETCGFQLWHAELERRMADGRLELLQGLDDFREHLGGRLTLMLPEGPGRTRALQSVEEAAVERALLVLHRRAPVQEAAR